MPKQSSRTYGESLQSFLADASMDWSVAVGVRMALRALPFAIGVREIPSRGILAMFRTAAISRYAALFPNPGSGAISSINAATAQLESVEADLTSAKGAPRAIFTSIRLAASIVARSAVASRRSFPQAIIDEAVSCADVAATGIAEALNRRGTGAFPEPYASVMVADMGERTDSPRESADGLVGAPLWFGVSWADDNWLMAADYLQQLGPSWQVWVNWYAHVLAGASWAYELEAAFVDGRSSLPWNRGPGAVSKAIRARLEQIAQARGVDVDTLLASETAQDKKHLSQNSRTPALSSDLPIVPAQRPAAIEPIWEGGSLRIPRQAAKTDLSGRKFVSALKGLRAELSAFADEISGEANIDRRFIAQLRQLAERIPQKPPRQDELFRIGHHEAVFEGYAKIVEEQWPDHLAARYHALTLHFDRTMRQSPVWREFKQNASRITLTEQQILEAAPLAKEMASALKDEHARNFVDPALPEAIELLAGNLLEAKSSSSDRSGGAEAEELLAADLIDSVNNVLKRIAEAAMSAKKPLASAGAAAGATLSKASKGFVTEFGKGLERGAKKEGARAGEDTVKWLRRVVIYGGAAAAGAEFGLPALIAKFPAIAEWLPRISHFLHG